jgi:hypothetical protein
MKLMNKENNYDVNDNNDNIEDDFEIINYSNNWSSNNKNNGNNNNRNNNNRNNNNRNNNNNRDNNNNRSNNANNDNDCGTKKSKIPDDVGDDVMMMKLMMIMVKNLKDVIFRPS